MYNYSCPIRKEVIYVGCGCKARPFQHLKRKDNHPLTNRISWIRNQGQEPIIEITEYDCEVREEISIREIYQIHIIGRKDLNQGPLLNLTDGGEGVTGLKWSEESKLNSSKMRKGAVWTQEHKDNISMGVKLSLLDPIKRKKISKTHKDKPKNPEHKAKLQKHLEKFQQDISRRNKAAEILRNRILTDDQRKRIGEGVSKFVSNTIWINDGKITKRILKTDSIPDGFVRGRSLNKRKNNVDRDGI